MPRPTTTTAPTTLRIRITLDRDAVAYYRGRGLTAEQAGAIAEGAARAAYPAATVEAYTTTGIGAITAERRDDDGAPAWTPGDEDIPADLQDAIDRAVDAATA